MTIARKRFPGAATAPLVYWLLLVCGLALLTVARIDALPKVAPLWLGACAGTALGQLLAARRMRLWLVLFVVVNSMWLGAILAAPLWLSMWAQHNVWDSVELTLLSFAPAAVCGYLSLSERAGLVAFWFPAVPWTLAILDDPGPTVLDGARGWGLLGLLGALLVGFLHARETRRVALWKGYALETLSRPRSQAVLREAPLRPAAPAVWVAALGAATLLLTGWIAPQLWQREESPARGQSPAAAGGTTGGSGDAGAACCPTAAPVKRERVREYFEVLRAHDAPPPAPTLTPCVACQNGKPIPPAPAGTGATGPGTGAGTGSGEAGPSATASPTATAVPSAPSAHGQPSSTTTAPAPAPPPIAASPRPADPRPQAATPALPPPPSGKPPRSRAVRMAPAIAAPASLESQSPLPWLLTLALAGMAVQIGVRPLRRLLTLQHLRRPLWAETVDQRVSNLWELALIGLRDVGFRPAPGEQPQELARRVGLPALSTCAGVLERARHGVRVDAADVETMTRAAEAVYRDARRRAGWAGRAAGWLRWPLA